MIRTQTQVPSTYYIRSRDFQLLGRLYDLAFNSSKFFADVVAYNARGEGDDANILDLMAKTVGFDIPRKYDIADLSSLCKSFKSIMACKGSKKAIEDCVRMLLNAQNINSGFDVDVINNITDADGNTRPVYKVQIMIPQQMNDISLLEDMLEYILPVGYVYEILIGDINRNDYGEVDAVVGGAYEADKYADDRLGRVVGGDYTPGVSTMFATSTVYDEGSTSDNG